MICQMIAIALWSLKPKKKKITEKVVEKSFIGIYVDKQLSPIFMTVKYYKLSQKVSKEIVAEISIYRADLSFKQKKIRLMEKGRRCKDISDWQRCVRSPRVSVKAKVKLNFWVKSEKKSKWREEKSHPNAGGRLKPIKKSSTKVSSQKCGSCDEIAKKIFYVFDKCWNGPDKNRH